MIKTIDDFLKDKFTLHEVTGYGGWGEVDSHIVMVADNREELEDYCRNNNFDYKGSWSSYMILSPSKNK